MDDKDITVGTYQDAIDSDDDATDPIIDEETDDPTEGFGVPPEEFKEELDKYDIDETGEGDENMREEIEDQDDDPEE